MNMIAEKAARLEREGDYAAAQEHWEAAAEYFHHPLNVEWATIRAAFCAAAIRNYGY